VNIKDPFIVCYDKRPGGETVVDKLIQSNEDKGKEIANMKERFSKLEELIKKSFSSKE
jgi:hypothetical protein